MAAMLIAATRVVYAGGLELPDNGTEALVSRTPTGRLVTMADVVDASRFLLENPAINGINLPVDGGWLCM